MGVFGSVLIATTVVTFWNTPTRAAAAALRFVPTIVQLDQVSHRYHSIAWQRRLFSSTPIREFAIQDITHTLGPGKLILICGDSSSGKTTLLQTILRHGCHYRSSNSISRSKNKGNQPRQLRQQQPQNVRLPHATISGNVTIGSMGNGQIREGSSTTAFFPDANIRIGKTSATSFPYPAYPVYLDRQPDWDTYLTIQQVVDQCWKTLSASTSSSMSVVSSLNTARTGVNGASSSKDRTGALLLLRTLLQYIWSPPITDVEAFMAQCRVGDLCPSERYRLAILLACVQSSCCSRLDGTHMAEFPNENSDDNNSSLNDRNGNECNNWESAEWLLPAPILLLDEWMDTETSVVTQTVQKALWELVQQTGGVVCVVTHKMNRWLPSHIHERIHLRSGRIVAM